MFVIQSPWAHMSGSRAYRFIAAYPTLQLHISAHESVIYNRNTRNIAFIDIMKKLQVITKIWYGWYMRFRTMVTPCDCPKPFQFQIFHFQQNKYNNDTSTDTKAGNQISDNKTVCRKTCSGLQKWKQNLLFTDVYQKKNLDICYS